MHMLTALYPNSYHDSLVISFGNNIHNNELSQLSLALGLSNFFYSSRIIYYCVFVIHEGNDTFSLIPVILNLVMCESLELN